MSLKIPGNIFKKNAREVAFVLLGSNMLREINGKNFSFEIKEVEIYEGFNDRASHVFKGKTERNKLMFEEGGIFYIYLVYGVHFMLNVVVGKKDYPAAILIRGVNEYNGPGKITKALSVDKSLNGKKIGRKAGLWFEKNKRKGKIKKLPRIGVDYAGEFWKREPLRFVKEL